jgi:hypothetical protein
MLKKYPVHKECREREWYEWATGTGGANFQAQELPLIAKYYGAFWDDKISETQTLTDADLNKVKMEIISLLEASDLIPASDTPFVLKRVSTRTRQNVTANEHIDVNQDRRVRPRLSMNKEEVVENIYHLSASKISPKFQKFMYQLPVELEHGSDDKEE